MHSRGKTANDPCIPASGVASLIHSESPCNRSAAMALDLGLQNTLATGVFLLIKKTTHWKATVTVMHTN